MNPQRLILYVLCSSVEQQGNTAYKNILFVELKIIKDYKNLQEMKENSKNQRLENFLPYNLIPEIKS